MDSLKVEKKMMESKNKIKERDLAKYKGRNHKNEQKYRKT